MARKQSGFKVDPFTAGLRSYNRRQPFDPDFGAKCTGWGTVSAQCLYERGRLKAAEASRTKEMPG